MRRLALVLAAATLSVVGITTAAQAAPGLPLAVSDLDTSAYPEVTVTVAAPPALSGQVLPPEAFTVTESGKPVAARVMPLPADQLEVILVMDTSGSMAGEAMAAAKRSATAFLAAMPPAVRIAVVGFSTSPAVVSDFTLDRPALAAAIEGLVARGETSLYDAVVVAASQFPRVAGTYRSMVLLSDGGDTTSKGSLDDAMRALDGADLHLDVVELVSVESNAVALGQLAAAGEGRVARADDPGALDAVFGGIAASLTNQYRVSYTSRASGPVKVEVTLTHGGVTAQGAVAADLPVAPPAAPAPTAAGPRPAPRPEPATIEGPLLAAGALAFFVAFWLIGIAVFLPHRRRSARLARLGHATMAAQPSSAPAAISGLAHRASEAADTALERRGKRGALNIALERAAIALRPGEFIVLVGCIAVTALLTGLLLSGSSMALLGVIMVVVGARVALSMRASRRQAKFGAQLSDTLQLLSGSLRAGYGLLQAFDAVAREAPSPTAEEFRRVVVESRLGRGLSESLHAMEGRVVSEDFEWVVGAIEINREVGGDLAEVLDTVAGTIRERDYLRRQVKSLSAEGRLSAYVLLALPVFVALMIRLRNPLYFGELTAGIGLVMSGFGVFLMLIGALWLRKICRLVF